MNKLKKQPFKSEHLSKLLPQKRHDQNYSVKKVKLFPQKRLYRIY